MRILWVISAAAVMALVGCTDGTTTTTPSPSPTTGGTNQVASCLIGRWQSLSVKSGAAISGGAGVVVNIAASGDVAVDFAKMQPVTFDAQIATTHLKGSFVYAGQASTKIRTDSPTAMSGTWEPAGPIDWSKVWVTVDLTEPVKARPVDNLPVADYLGDKSNETGGVVDIDPLLGKARYTCEGATLTIAPEDTNGLVWTLGRPD